MRKILLGFLGIFLLPQISFANDQCKQAYQLSYAFMEARQANIPITKQMAIIDGMSDGKNDKILRVYRMIVTAAYDKPRYETKENKEKAARDFANDTANICYKNQ